MMDLVIPAGINPTVDKAYDIEGKANAALSSADVVVNAMFDTIENAINEELEPLVSSISTALEPVQAILKTTGSTIGQLAAIASIVPTDVTVVPSLNVNATMTGLGNSARQIANAIAQKAKDAYNAAKIEVVNMGYPSLESIYDFIIEMIDKLALYYLNMYCKKYTGYTYIEIRYMCAEGFKMLRAIREDARKKRVKAKNLDQDSMGIDSYDEELDYDGEDPDEGPQVSRSEKLKAKLKEWLDKQGDALWNAFMFKSMIDDFKQMKEMFMGLRNNFNLDELDSFTEYLETFMNMCYESGALDGEVIENPVDLSVLTGALKSLQTAAAVYGAQALANVQEAAHNEIMNGIQAGTDAATKALTAKSLFYVEDEVEGILVISLRENPALSSAKKKLVNAIKNSDMFYNSVINSIVQDCIDYYANPNGISQREYTSKSGKNFTIKYIIETVQDLKGDSTSLDVLEQNEIDQGYSLYVHKEEVIREEDNKRKVVFIIQTCLKILAQLLSQIKIIRTLLGYYRENKDFVKNGCRLTLANMQRHSKKENGQTEEIPASVASALLSNAEDAINDVSNLIPEGLPELNAGNCTIIDALGIAVYSPDGLDEIGSQILRAKRDNYVDE